MKTKIVIGSILAIFMLIMIPSISAIEVNTVMDTNKQSIEEATLKLKTMIRNVRQKISDLKQELNNPFVNLELVLIVVFNILTMILVGKPSILLSLQTVGLLLILLANIFTEDDIQICSKVHGAVVISFTYFLVVLTSTIVPNKITAKVISSFIFLIGYTLGLILMFSASSCSSC